MSEDAVVVTAGFNGVLGLSWIEVTGDRVRCTVQIGPEHHQPAGIVHGGVYCAIVETLASVGGAAWAGPEWNVVGVNNNTDFLRSVSEGALSAEALPLHRGRSQQLWEVTVRDEAARLVARGNVRLANLMVG
ncbi:MULTISPECIES: PaaI family thioesterase [Nocardia]|uniref:PaaI family thioesterase n=1 Tax=Nocardia TaxID=1817 RepID=UPI000D695A34|nr:MULTISPECIES: PaaI family thioesterase [Nocardia]